MPLTICRYQLPVTKIFINESRNAMENAPKSAEYIRDSGPPFMFIPPKTSAMSIFMPTVEPDDDESVGVSTIIAKAASPIPIPARANERTVSFFAFMPESRAHTGLPPRNLSFLPSFVK